MNELLITTPLTTTREISDAAGKILAGAGGKYPFPRSLFASYTLNAVELYALHLHYAETNQQNLAHQYLQLHRIELATESINSLNPAAAVSRGERPKITAHSKMILAAMQNYRQQLVSEYQDFYGKCLECEREAVGLGD